MDSENLIIRLFRIRKTRKDLARRAGISPEHLSRLIHGSRTWSNEIEDKVREALEKLEREGRAAA